MAGEGFVVQEVADHIEDGAVQDRAAMLEGLVAEGLDEMAFADAGRRPRSRSGAEVNLRLGTRCALQTTEGKFVIRSQLGRETQHAVIARREAMLGPQILPDTLRRQCLIELALDELAKRPTRAVLPGRRGATWLDECAVGQPRQQRILRLGNHLIYASRYSLMALLTRQVEYKYDAFGNRLAKEIDLDGEGELGVEVQRYAIDGWNPAKPSPVGNENFDVIADLDGSSSLTTRYVRGDKVDEVNVRIENVESALTAYWNLVDHQGSARDIIINNGDIKDSIKYDSFGKIVIESDDTFRGRYTWTSRELDKETELQFNRARYYDATIGRWISQDPMGFDAGDSNLYRYVNNRPTMAVDPSGLIPLISPILPIQPYLGLPYNGPQLRATGGANEIPMAPLIGGSGNVLWPIRWELSMPAQKSGWIIQEISVQLRDKAGRWTDISKDAPKSHYLEAWHVTSQKKITDILIAATSNPAPALPETQNAPADKQTRIGAYQNLVWLDKTLLDAGGIQNSSRRRPIESLLINVNPNNFAKGGPLQGAQYFEQFRTADDVFKIMPAGFRVKELKRYAGDNLRGIYQIGRAFFVEEKMRRTACQYSSPLKNVRRPETFRQHFVVRQTWWLFPGGLTATPIRPAYFTHSRFHGPGSGILIPYLMMSQL